MEIKEAILAEEKEQIGLFLASFDLSLDNDVDKTLYVEEDNRIIATISKADYIIKDMAILPNYQSENLSSFLLSRMLEIMNEQKIYSYQVFTKPQYEEIYHNFGFRTIVKTSRVLMLEGGVETINDVLAKMKSRLELQFSTISEKSDIGSVVINANPFTIGHQYLIEEIAKRHQIVIVFLVEENLSEFSFVERSSMAYLATKHLLNVLIFPSTKYIVSKLTFPTYFLKNSDEVNEETARVDALIYRDYFMKQLYIKKRYVGTETTEKMTKYNSILQEELKEKLVVLQRLSWKNKEVSASTVRRLLKEKRLSEALNLIPRENALILTGIAKERYGC